jgi:hypothetical protein
VSSPLHTPPSQHKTHPSLVVAVYTLHRDSAEPLSLYPLALSPSLYPSSIYSPPSVLSPSPVTATYVPPPTLNAAVFSMQPPSQPPPSSSKCGGASSPSSAKRRVMPRTRAHFRGYTKNRWNKNTIIRMVGIQKVETKSNLADGFTKPFTGSAFAIFASLVTKVI